VSYQDGYFHPLVEIEQDPETWVMPEDWEVIGNIYENPELLIQQGGLGSENKTH
jgi:hypothetical protein